MMEVRTTLSRCIVTGAAFLLFLAPICCAPALAAPAVSAAGSAALTGAAASAVDPGTYVLSPDDVVEVSVLNHTELQAAVTILPDGTFDYPVLGTVHAAGQTISGLTHLLTKGLSKDYNQPEVTVYLRQGRARRISIMGDGSKVTGEFDFRTGMHLLDLITAAGGLAGGEPELVTATLLTDNGKQVTPINLVPLMNGTDMSQNLPLAPGDLLILTARNPEVGLVQVVGEVAKPGAYSVMTSGVSILALLNEAGGALPSARLTEVQVKHNSEVQTVNLRPLLTSDLRDPAGSIRLVPGDQLLVPANKNVVLALGEVRQTGVLAIPDDQPLTLVRAYALVGGATDNGDKKNVDIVRRTPSGKAQLLSINMDDLLRGKNDVTDITMQPDDILYIQPRNKKTSLSDILSSLGSVGSAIYTGRILGL